MFSFETQSARAWKNRTICCEANGHRYQVIGNTCRMKALRSRSP